MNRHILAISGGGFSEQQNVAIDQYLILFYDSHVSSNLSE